MATVTFDTLELVDKLKAAGFAPEQAEAVVRVVAQAQSNLVTRETLNLALAPVRSDLALLKWMIGFLLAGVAALIVKGFFG